MNKTTIIATIIMALALASVTVAQQAPPPLPGTYYLLKDSHLPPFPVNPYPHLEAAEIEPGIFLVDDTVIPDTPERAVARAARRAAQELAPQTDPATAQRLAEEAARQRQERYEREFFWRGGMPDYETDRESPRPAELGWQTNAKQSLQSCRYAGRSRSGVKRPWKHGQEPLAHH